ncbi:MAG: hypothetical protein QM490_00565 [Candidatus Gracilibacteria bacterium]
MPALDNINTAAGMLDNIASADIEDAQETAKQLFEYFKSFLDDDSDEDLDIKSGKLYGFLIQHNTIVYIDSFIELLVQKQSDKKMLHKVLQIAQIIVYEGIHRKAIKFGIAIISLFDLSDDNIELFIIRYMVKYILIKKKISIYIYYEHIIYI